jgi:hypothetical protein
MKTLETLKEKSEGINPETLNELVDNHKKINKLLKEGKNIAPELTENFVTFPIHNNPYQKLGL